MIPDSRLPPRHLHAVQVGKTSAVIKWESPYDSPDQDLVSGKACTMPTMLVLSRLWGSGVQWRGSGSVTGDTGTSWARQALSPFLCGQRQIPFWVGTPPLFTKPYFFVLPQLAPPRPLTRVQHTKICRPNPACGLFFKNQCLIGTRATPISVCMAYVCFCATSDRIFCGWDPKTLKA